MHEEMEKATLEFFKTGWLMLDFNANTLILIPKVPGVNSIHQFNPIAMANFKFKMIYKILTYILVGLMPTLISFEQRGFIQGRNIKGCVCLASEVINIMHHKSFVGTLALKIYVVKAFDTL